VRAFEQRLKYAHANVETQKGVLRFAETQFREGAASKLDVTQARSNLAQTEKLIPVLERGLRQANNQLCVLLGTPPRDLSPELGPAEIPESPAEVVVGIPAELLRRRPDVRRAEREVAAQSAQIGVAAADLFPAFTINGSINWQAAKFSNLFGPAANAGFIAPTFNWDILNYGRIMNNIRGQDARFQQLAIEYQQAVLDANAEAENAVYAFLRAKDRLRSLQESVDATAESTRLVTFRWKEGAEPMNRVYVLQRDLVLVQDELAVGQADVALSLIRIYRALGGGWQIRYGYGAAEDWAGTAETIQLPQPSEAEGDTDAQE
jgi:NodT family efflux transporter outer membrane factor (OMF) lipoprotein